MSAATRRALPTLALVALALTACVTTKGTPAEYKAAMGQSPVQVIDMNPGDKKQF